MMGTQSFTVKLEGHKHIMLTFKRHMLLSGTPVVAHETLFLTPNLIKYLSLTLNYPRVLYAQEDETLTHLHRHRDF